MKTSPMSARKKRILFLGIMAFLLILGIGLAFNTTVRSRRSIFEEHDAHLYDLVSSVDHNTASVLQRCRLELAAITGSSTVAAAEAHYAETGDDESLRLLLAESELLTTDYAMRIIVRRIRKSCYPAIPETV